MVTKINKYTVMQKSQYDGLASTWNVDNLDPVVGTFNLHNAHEDYEFLFTDIPDQGSKIVLDFGCGPGRNLVKYSGRFKRIDGVDISLANLENAAIWLKHNGVGTKSNLFQCNGVDLKFIADEQYNIVMSTICLQHICVHEIRFNYLKEFFRVLEPNGHIAIQMGYGVPSPWTVDYYANNYEALGTNRVCDTDISNCTQVEKDLLKIGFVDFKYHIRPTGPGDCHPNWIFFNARKPACRATLAVRVESLKQDKIKVVSFASEGPPHDEGLPIAVHLETFGAACLAGGADEFMPFTPRTLVAADPSKAWAVRNTGDENDIGGNTIGYHKVGLGAWRAVLLNKVIDESADGDIIVFHDCNIIKYPGMLDFAANLRKYVIWSLETCNGDLFAPMNYSVGSFTKRSVFERLVPDVETLIKISEAPLGRCRLIIARVSPATRAFAKLFEAKCTNTSLLTPHPSERFEPHEQFCWYNWNTAEQSVFNVLAYSTGMFPLEWRGTWIEKYRSMGLEGDLGFSSFCQ